MADHAQQPGGRRRYSTDRRHDTGYGNALSVRARCRRTRRRRGRAAHRGPGGAQALRPPLGPSGDPARRVAGKIRAAADARTEFRDLLASRAPTRSPRWTSQALRRGEAAVKAGADILFVEAPRDEKQVERVARAFDTPLLQQHALGAARRCPFARLRELARNHPAAVDTLLVGVKAIADFLAEVRTRDDVLSMTDRYMHSRTSPAYRHRQHVVARCGPRQKSAIASRDEQRVHGSRMIAKPSSRSRRTAAAASGHQREL